MIRKATMFGSNNSSKLSSLIERMKQSESALMTFASRFSHYHDENSHVMEVFDTEIPRSSVQALKDGEKCQLFNNHHLVMHGIKVQSNLVNTKNYDNNTDDDYKKAASPLVLLHGYANGSLYFYRNLLGLSNYISGGTVYALDLLGWGLSSRPAFKTKSIDGYDDVGVAEQFFVESLEAWRKEHKIERMILGGHSMGGYVSIAYAEKYPQHVDKLVLLSPVGIPDDKTGGEKEFEERKKDMSMSTRFMIGVASSLWNYGVTPSSFIRSMPESRGRRMVSNYVENRLPAITCPDERNHLTEYLYTNAILPGSGEDCLNKILKPFAFPKKPALHRIPYLGVKNVYFIYGQNDWMDVKGGLEAQRICRKLKEDGKENVPDVQVMGVKNSGHLLMLENWREFNNAIILACGEGRRLPNDSPKPYSFNDIEQDPSTFFRKPRWERRDPKNITEETSPSTA